MLNPARMFITGNIGVKDEVTGIITNDYPMNIRDIMIDLGISKVFGGFSDGNTTSRLSLNFMFIKPMRDAPTKTFTNSTTGSSISDRTTRYSVGMVFNTTNSRGGTGHIVDIRLE